MLTKPSPKNVYRKSVLIKICEREASKTSVPFLLKSIADKKNLKNIKEKQKLLVQIDKFQFYKAVGVKL